MSTHWPFQPLLTRYMNANIQQLSCVTSPHAVYFLKQCFLTFVYFIRAVLEVPFSFLLSLPGCSFIALSELKWSGAELVSSEVTSPPSQAFCSSEKLLDPANSCPAVLISAGSASTASPGGQRISCQNKSTIVQHWQQWMNILRETKRFFLHHNPGATNLIETVTLMHRHFTMLRKPMGRF